MTLSLDTAYRSFGGEVEASSTPTICRLPDSRRHQLSAIAPEPAEPHQLRDLAGVVAVRLHRHRLEGIAHVACLQKLDRKASLLHGRIEPLRQRPRLKSDPGELKPERTEPADQRLRFAHHLGLPDDLAARVDHAHA